ncbi:hypothetical protein TL16_g13359, partial [Triparma laevis f. inornata]
FFVGGWVGFWGGGGGEFVEVGRGVGYEVCGVEGVWGMVLGLIFKLGLVGWGIWLSLGTEELPTKETSESRGIREATVLAGMGCVVYMGIWAAGVFGREVRRVD